jgi:hypothetical protein
MLVAFLQGCAQDNSRFEIAKNFVADIKEGHKTDIEIITQYLAADTATRREKLQILSMLFSAMRNGQLKSMDVNLLEATEYSEQLAPQILVLTEEEKRNIIFITYNSKLLYPILFTKDNKILAFNYMDKGKYKYMIAWH